MITMLSDFLKENWRLIVELLILIVSLIIWIVRKRPSINEIDNIMVRVLELLPDWINSAESIKGATEKKALVLECARKFVKNRFSVDLPDSLLSIVSLRIEQILSTPQKH